MFGKWISVLVDLLSKGKGIDEEASYEAKIIDE